MSQPADFPIPTTGSAPLNPSADQERALLLTVARLLRAHMSDHMNHPDFSEIDQDWLDLNEALAPFDPTGEPFGTIAGASNG